MITRFGDLGLEANEDPIALMDCLEVESERFRVVVQCLRQCMHWLTRFDQRTNSCQIGHWDFPAGLSAWCQKPGRLASGSNALGVMAGDVRVRPGAQFGALLMAQW